MKLTKQNNGYVYLIRNKDNGLLKIGYTNNIERRLKEIEKRFEFTGVKPQLVVEHLFVHEDYVGLESYLHREFKEYRVQNEWFNIEDVSLVIEKGNSFVTDKEVKEVIAEDKVKTVDYLVLKGYDKEVIELMCNYYFCLRGNVLYKNLEDNKDEVIEEVVSYIEWTKEEFKQSIESELISENPIRSVFNFGPFGEKSFCYKVEFMIWLYELMYEEKVYEHLEFDIKNNFISTVSEPYPENLGVRPKTTKKVKRVVSEVHDEMGNVWELDYILSENIEFRKNILGKMSEEEINEFRERREKLKSYRGVRQIN